MQPKPSPYLCDSCQHRRNKDDTENKNFKCNTDKRRSVHYKGCDNFLAKGTKNQENAKPKKKVVKKNG